MESFRTKQEKLQKNETRGAICANMLLAAVSLFANGFGVYLTNIIPVPKTMFGSIVMTFVGLLIVGYTQGTYMMAALGCGPRDTLLVGLKKRLKKLPIGVVSILRSKKLQRHTPSGKKRFAVWSVKCVCRKAPDAGHPSACP